MYMYINADIVGDVQCTLVTWPTVQYKMGAHTLQKNMCAVPLQAAVCGKENDRVNKSITSRIQKIHLCACASVHTCIYMYIHIEMRMHTYIRTYIHTYSHIDLLNLGSSPQDEHLRGTSMCTSV